MARIFLSHSSKDSDVADAVKNWLKDKGHGPIFVHRHVRESGMVGIQDWEPKIAREVMAAPVVIVLASQAWADSVECVSEYKTAWREGTAVLPLQLDYDFVPEGVGIRQNLIPFSRFPTDDEWNHLAQALKRVGAEPDSFEPDHDRAPFPGIDPFEQADAAVFFGRMTDIVAARQLLRTMRRNELDKRLALVVGGSGAGKSSLLRAGLLARMEREPTEWICAQPVTPQRNLANALAAALRARTGLNHSEIKEALISDSEDEPIWRLIRIARERAGVATATVVISIDQLEELFTRGQKATALPILQRLTNLPPDRSGFAPVIVLGTMRSDSFPLLCESEAETGLRLETLRLAPIPSERLAEIIEKPLEVWYGEPSERHIQPELTQRVLSDARALGGSAESGDVLPLIAILLHDLWSGYGEEGAEKRLTAEHYEQTGGLAQIIDERAEETLMEIETELGVSRNELRAALVPHLATVNAAGVFVRDTAPAHRFEDHVARALDRFADKRILHSGRDDQGNAIYTMAHEVVLRKWRWLAEALHAEAEHLALQARIREEAAAWHHRGGPDDHLILEGERLEEAKKLRWPEGQVPEAIAAYILACEKKQRRRVETLAERERRLNQAQQQYLAARARMASDASDHLSAMRLALVAWALGEEGAQLHSTVPVVLATAASRSAVRLKMSGQSAPVESIAWSPDGTRLVSAEGRKLTIWDPTTGEPTGDPLIGHEDTVCSVAWSPDGVRIVSGSADKSLIVWDADCGKQIGEPLTGHAKEVKSVDWSPDGVRIVSGSADKRLIIWEADSGKQIGEPLTGHAWEVNSVAWSPDGARLVSGTWHGRELIIWNATAGKPIEEPLTDHNGSGELVAWSPDGARLVSTGVENDGKRNTIIWDTASGEECSKLLSGHFAGPSSVSWSPDGTRLVCAYLDGTLIIWDAATGKPVGEPLTGHGASVMSVAWSPDGARFVSGDRDGSLFVWDAGFGEGIGGWLARQRHVCDVKAVAWSPDGTRLVSTEGRKLIIWDAATGKPIGEPLTGHGASVVSVAWSPDGARLVSGDSGGSLFIWDAAVGERIGELLTGHGASVVSVVWSPDGARLVSVSFHGIEGASLDETLFIWDAVTGERIGVQLTDHTGPIHSVAWSPDGTRLISATWDKAFTIWDATSGEKIRELLSGHNGLVNSVAWSPDGARLVSVYLDGTLIIWDATTGEPIGEPSTDHNGSGELVAWSPDSARFVSVGNRKLIFWDGVTGERISEPLTGHHELVASVAWSPDGVRLFSAYRDGTLIIWDTTDGQRVGDPLTSYECEVFSVAWSPDGSCFAAGLEGGSWIGVIPWEYRLTGNDLGVAVARRRLQGAERLTEAECRILRELTGEDPDPDMIPKRWGYGGPDDDPFGDPTAERRTTIAGYTANKPNLSSTFSSVTRNDGASSGD